MKDWKMTYGSVWSERREGKGEDAEPLVVQYDTKSPCGVMGVFDGMGGSGSAVRTLSDGTTRTDAWLASRFIREKVLEWYEEHTPDHLLKEEEVMELQEYLIEKLENYKEELGIKPSGLQGKMTRVLPTTMATILWTTKKDGLFLNSIWAGDSRNYVLDSNGLRILTQDHVQGNNDAWTSLREDPPMTNVICQDKVWKLERIVDAMRYPSVLISCTDGCFGYLLTPMHFEKMLIETFLKAETMVEWMDNIKERLLPVAGDDFSMAVLMNREDWDKLKESLKKRLAVLEEKFIRPFEGIVALQNNIDFMKQCLWNKYADGGFELKVPKEVIHRKAIKDAVEDLYEYYQLEEGKNVTTNNEGGEDDGIR